jgi:hypothetical protein
MYLWDLVVGADVDYSRLKLFKFDSFIFLSANASVMKPNGNYD